MDGGSTPPLAATSYLELRMMDQMDWPFGDLQMFGYDMIMADPPWRFETRSPNGRLGNLSRAPDRHYTTLPVAEIIERFPIGHLASKDAILWLWCTHPMIDQQIEAGRAWGFSFSTTGVWVKRTANDKLGFGTGYRLRSASEPFAIFVNGDPETARNIRTVIEGPVREHSRKPDEAFAAAQRMVTYGTMGRCVEIFGRQSRNGWAVWGDENQKFDEKAA